MYAVSLALVSTFAAKTYEHIKTSSSLNTLSEYNLNWWSHKSSNFMSWINFNAGVFKAHTTIDMTWPSISDVWALAKLTSSLGHALTQNNSCLNKQCWLKFKLETPININQSEMNAFKSNTLKQLEQYIKVQLIWLENFNRLK